MSLLRILHNALYDVRQLKNEIVNQANFAEYSTLIERARRTPEAICRGEMCSDVMYLVESKVYVGCKLEFTYS